MFMRAMVIDRGSWNKFQTCEISLVDVSIFLFATLPSQCVFHPSWVFDLIPRNNFSSRLTSASLSASWVWFGCMLSFHAHPKQLLIKLFFQSNSMTRTIRNAEDSTSAVSTDDDTDYEATNWKKWYHKKLFWIKVVFVWSYVRKHNFLFLHL